MAGDPTISEQWDDATSRLQDAIVQLRTNLGLQIEGASIIASMPRFEKGELFVDEEDES